MPQTWVFWSKQQVLLAYMDSFQSVTKQMDFKVNFCIALTHSEFPVFYLESPEKKFYCSFTQYNNVCNGIDSFMRETSSCQYTNYLRRINIKVHMTLVKLLILFEIMGLRK